MSPRTNCQRRSRCRSHNGTSVRWHLPLQPERTRPLAGLMLTMLVCNGGYSLCDKTLRVLLDAITAEVSLVHNNQVSEAQLFTGGNRVSPIGRFVLGERPECERICRIQAVAAC